MTRVQSWTLSILEWDLDTVPHGTKKPYAMLRFTVFSLQSSPHMHCDKWLHDVHGKWLAFPFCGAGEVGVHVVSLSPYLGLRRSPRERISEE